MVQVVTPARERPVDPNTVIPPVVAANAAVANALQEQFIREQEAKAGGEESQEDRQEERQEERRPQPEPRVEQPAPKPQANDDESWQNRYHAMKGRFDRQGEQIRSLTEQIQAQQRALEQAAMQPRPQAQVTPEVKRLLTEDEVNDFGPEFLDVVGRRAEEIFMPRAQAYEQKIAQLEQQVAGVGGYVQRNARQDMMEELDQRVPGWRDVNLSDGFKSWLALPDPFTGAIRHEQLKAAWGRNATPQAEAFFKGFLAEEAATNPARGRLAPARAPSNGSPRPSLEDFAAPGRAKSAATGTVPAEKPVYTRPQITKFYTDCAAGRWKGREEERKRIDADIQLAGIEGRVS